MSCMTDPCGFCGKENKTEYSKCYQCYLFLKDNKVGTPCIICNGGTICEKEGKYGKFRTCSRWMMHPGGNHKMFVPAGNLAKQRELKTKVRKYKYFTK